MVCKLKKIIVKIVVSNLKSFLLKQIISIFQVGILNFEKKKVSSSWTSKFIRRRIQLYVKNVRCRISLLALKITWKLKLTTSTYIQTSRSKMESQIRERTSVSKLQNLNLDDNLTKTSIMDISKFSVLVGSVPMAYLKSK